MIRDTAVVCLVKNDLYWLPYALHSIKGWFGKVILYDTGSTDGTVDVLKFYKDELEKAGAKVVLELFPDMCKRSQLALRNSMFAECLDYRWAYMLDGDEVLSENSLFALEQTIHKAEGKLYGVVNRTEVASSLVQAYSPNGYVNHHRLYKIGKVIARGSHPGEYYEPKQQGLNEFKFTQDVTVYHFHGTLRSPKERDALLRLERKTKATYQPGNLESFDLFEKLPILKKPLHGFPVNPVLESLQRDLND